MPSIALPVSLRGQLLSGVRFSPATLFAANEPGVWYDPSDVCNESWRRNLFVYSDQFNNSAWSKVNSTTVSNVTAAPDGSLTADKFMATATTGVHSFWQYANTFDAGVYTFSVFAKAAEHSKLQLAERLSGTWSATFDLATGVALVVSGTSALSSSIQPAGGGWYRCSVTIRYEGGLAPATALASYPDSGAVLDNFGASYTGDGTSGVFLWGAQFEAGTSATDYQKFDARFSEFYSRFPNATLFVNSAGNPVSTPGQTVALILDKSQNLARGPELIVNGSFDNGLTGWTQSNVGTGTATVEDGQLVLSLDGSSNVGGAGQQIVGVVAGKLYEIIVTITGGAVNVTAGTALGSTDILSVNGLGTGTSRLFFTAAATTWITFRTQSVSYGSGKVGNISVRELPGNHATQATAASRPTYGIVPRTGRRNLLTFTEQFDNAAWQVARSGTAAVAVKTPNFGIAPDGTQTACRVQLDVSAGSAGNQSQMFQTYAATGGIIQSVWIKTNNGSTVTIEGLTVGASTPETITVTGNWQRLSATSTAGGSFNFQVMLVKGITSDTADLLVWRPQAELGSTATAYQRVGSAFDVTEAGVPSLSYLSFDGVDDFLVTPTITPGIDKAQVFAGVRKLSDAAQGVIIESSVDTSANAGSFAVIAPGTNATANYRWRVGGTTNVNNASASSFAAPISNVLTATGDISGDRAILRANGVEAINSTADQGTGNYLAYPIYIGRRGGTTLPFNGNIFSLIVRFGANLDANTISNTETWVNSKTGAY